ncbi:DUF2789 domain-containing protein [Pseudomonas sp. R5(2019)]|uniref:DUF2789 domain-containing protein n=1 Tax=Pseudomonas sp. R5(2019) TaxID=2697566 RepID=UPI0014126366|nr:DUF2789 domain-containing protein [Pseudomonas sp. R5(2019)]NBA98319.1 DUF2789 family protein [Pseudomonas sp. R5(2019)]
MDLQHLTLATLFDQLGLDSDPASIDAFIESHPLPKGIKLSDAEFWSTQQAKLLKDKLMEDDDWAPVVDDLNERLHPR